MKCSKFGCPNEAEHSHHIIPQSCERGFEQINLCEKHHNMIHCFLPKEIWKYVSNKKPAIEHLRWWTKRFLENPIRLSKDKENLIGIDQALFIPIENRELLKRYSLEYISKSAYDLLISNNKLKAIAERTGQNYLDFESAQKELEEEENETYQDD